MEDEPDDLRPVAGLILQPDDVFAAHHDRAGIRPVERPDQVQQRALARSRRPGQGDEVTALEAKRHVSQRADPPILEGLADAFEDDLDAAQRGRTQ